jgi:hypothetical protein
VVKSLQSQLAMASKDLQKNQGLSAVVYVSDILFLNLLSVSVDYECRSML